VRPALSLRGFGALPRATSASRCFAGFHMETIAITYQVGGGHKGADRTELLIFSWDVTREPAGLF
jgi:hypothetical protein